MSDQIPLGAERDRRLEFEGRDALRKPEVIGRAVVSMLNAEGGTLWVGLRAEEGRAVAVEPIADPVLARRRVFEYLSDAIEPVPAEGEISVDTPDGAVLRIELTPDVAHRPYALLGQGGRQFLTRTERGLRRMSRKEIFTRSTGKISSEPEVEAAIQRVLAERKEAQAAGTERYWLRIEPLARGTIDLHDPFYQELLLEPSLSGNRRAGWSFAHAQHQPIVEGDRLVTAPEDLSDVEIRRRGGFVFQMPLFRLHWTGEPREIASLVLWEYTVSAFRIADKVCERAGWRDRRLVADLALFGAGGWRLRRPSPWHPLDRSGALHVYEEATDLTSERPLVFDARAGAHSPDDCGRRLLERVYEAFGLGRDAAPVEFEETSGRLILDE